MASQIAWLDADPGEQARMRDVIRLFTDRDSRDELGLGQVRDALSDGLFPGTSTLLTRARYLVFVPWCFRRAEHAPEPLAASERFERELITGLRRSGADDLAGLLGVRVGEALRVLPSVVYWGALRYYGIVGAEYVTRTDVFRPSVHADDGDAVADPAQTGAWTPGTPPVPDGFPSSVPTGFALTGDEAGWLRDRMLERTAGSLLAHLLDHEPLESSPTPWSDPSARAADGAPAALLRTAEAFSTTMQGASLLYNLMLGEEYERDVPEEHRRLTEPVASYRGALADWAGRVETARLDDWQVADLWDWTDRRAQVAVAPSTRRFVDRWSALVRSHGSRGLPDDDAARRLVRERERHQKGAMARLGNPRRIAAWSGAAGAAPMTYRWATVRGLVRDIHDGLGRRDA